MISSSARITNLILYLSEPRLTKGMSDIARDVKGYPSENEAFAKQFRRDREAIKKLGIDVEQIGDEFFINLNFLDSKSLNLNITEIHAIKLSATEAANNQGFFMQDALMRAINKLSDALGDFSDVYIETSIKSSERDKLKLLEGAINSSAAIAFDYQSASGAGSNRKVRAESLFFYAGAWYLSAVDIDKVAMRTFKIERMENVRKRATEDGRPYEKPSPSLEDGVGCDSTPHDDIPHDDASCENAPPPKLDSTPPSPFRFKFQMEGEPFEAKLAFDAKHEIYVRRLTMGIGKLEKTGRKLIWTVKATNVEKLLEWVIETGMGIKILQPEDAEKRLKASLKSARKGAFFDEIPSDLDLPKFNTSANWHIVDLSASSADEPSKKSGAGRPSEKEELARLFSILHKLKGDVTHEHADTSVGSFYSFDDLAHEMNVSTREAEKYIRHLIDVEDKHGIALPFVIVDLACDTIDAAHNTSDAARGENAVLSDTEPESVKQCGIQVFNEKLLFDKALRLSPEESEALILALKFTGADANDALIIKLSQYALSAHADSDAFFMTIENMIDFDLLARLNLLCTQHRYALIDHLKDGASDSKQRLVRPYKIFQSEFGYWYLIAFDEGASDFRIFRLDRILEIAEQAKHFDPNEHVFEDTDFRSAIFGIHKTTTFAILKFEASEIIDSTEFPHILQVGEVTDDGSRYAMLPYVNEQWLARKVLSRLGKVKLLAPASAQKTLLKYSG